MSILRRKCQVFFTIVDDRDTYGAHCFELYGVRTWLGGFWTYVMAHQGAPSWMSPVAVSLVLAVVSVPASILGNEAALKFDRHRAITAVMIASASGGGADRFERRCAGVSCRFENALTCRSAFPQVAAST